MTALEEIARLLDDEAHTLRELGRYGARALGEGERLPEALWGVSAHLVEAAEAIDRIAHRIDEADGDAAVGPCE